MAFVRWRALLPTVLAVVMVVTLWAVNVSGAAAPVQISSDVFTDPATQHQTEIEPYVAAFGSTIVSVFQAGRNSTGGSDGIEYATSTNSGATWAHTGTLPGIIGGAVAFASNTTVAYDAKHATWMVLTEGLSSGLSGVGLFLNTSTDGFTWTTATDIEPAGSASWDKPALVCDNTATSPHFGTCYAQWDDFSASPSQLIWLSTSSDGGKTWSAKVNTPDSAAGFSGQAVVTPNGTVVIPYTDPTQSSIRAITSTTGGASWAASVPVASSVSWEAPPFGMGNASTGMRLYLLASAGADQSGTVYVAWQETNLEPIACCLNDIVMAKSTNGGATWSTPTAITPPGSGNDAFLPALTADSKAAGHPGLEYFAIPNAGALTGKAANSCTAAGPPQCQIFVDFMSSIDGGTTWTTSTAIAGPMTLPQLAQSTAAPMGAMLGDYVTTAFLNGSVFPVFPLGAAPSGGHAFNEGMWAIPDGILVGTATPTVTPTGTGTMSPTVTPTSTRSATVTVTRTTTVTATSTATPTPQPDLVVSALRNPPATVTAGHSFTTSSITANIGSGNAPASTTRFYLSLAPTRGSGSVLLTGSASIPALAPGAQSSQTTIVGVPSATTLGTYYLIACADDLHQVSESNESNNCRASTKQVKVV
jgi:hypothetical protein